MMYLEFRTVCGRFPVSTDGVRHGQQSPIVKEKAPIGH